MNIMNLIPQKEYERLKNKNQPKQPDSKLSNRSENIINSTGRMQNACISQLNQTKVEHGGKQTIINNCKQNENDDDDDGASNIDTKIKFPEDDTFDNIGSDKVDIGKQTSKDESINNSGDDQITDTAHSNLNDNARDSNANNMDSEREDDVISSNIENDVISSNIGNDIDNLTGDKLPDNLDYNGENLSPITETEENTPALGIGAQKSGSDQPNDDNIEKAPVEDGSEELNKELELTSSEGDSRVANNDDATIQDKMLPPASSSSLDDKYEIWRDRNQYKADSEIWQNDDESEEGSDSDSNGKTDVITRTAPYRYARNPYFKMKSKSKKPSVVITRRSTPYSKMRTATTGGFKKTNTIVSAHSKDNFRTPIQTISIPSHDHTMEKTVNDHIGYSGNDANQVKIQGQTRSKKFVKKRKKITAVTPAAAESENKREIEEMLQKEIEAARRDIEETTLDEEDVTNQKEKKASRKRTVNDWLPAKVQGRVSVKEKLKTRSQNFREKMRDDQLDKRRNSKVKVSTQYDNIPAIADIESLSRKRGAKFSKQVGENAANKIIDDLLDPKRPKLRPQTPRISNYTIWNQQRK